MDYEIPAIVQPFIDQLVKDNVKVTAKALYSELPDSIKATVNYPVVQIWAQIHNAKVRLDSLKGKSKSLTAFKAIDLVSAILNSANPSLDDIRSVVDEYYSKEEE